MLRNTRIAVAAAIYGLGLAAALAAPAAMAAKGDWIIRGGATMVDPKSKSLNIGDLTDVEDVVVLENAYLNVDDKVGFGFNVTYMMTDNLGIELLAAAPFKHDVNLCGNPPGESGGCVKLATVEQLPPTLSLQWHFLPEGTFRPYVGIGFNWTMFSSEEWNSALQTELDNLGLGDTSLSLDDSTGFEAEVGMDFAIGEKWLINGSIRYIDMSSDVKVKDSTGASAKLGTVDLNPMVYSIMLGYKF